MKKHSLLSTAGLLGLLLLFSLFFFKTDAQAATKRTVPLDLTMYTSGYISNGSEQWQWDANNKILYLNGVDIETTEDNGIYLPAGDCTIEVTGTNSVNADYAAISCSEYEDKTKVLTVNGTGTLKLTSGTKGFQWQGDMEIKDISLYLDVYWGFSFVRKLTFNNTYVNAVGTSSSYHGSYQLIGVDDEEGEAASLTLKNCYVKEGGAKVRQSKWISFIGSGYDTGSKKIVISRGASPYKVAKVSTKTMKFKKNYTQLGISWKVPKYASGTYTVWRSTRKKSGYKKIATVYAPYYKDKGRAFHKTYYYKIRAYTQGKPSSYSVSGYKGVTTGLAKSTYLEYIRNTYSDDMSWNKVYGAQGYKIYRATSYKGKYTCIKTITKGTTLSFKAKRPKKTKYYYYKIRAYRKKGKKTYYSGYTEGYENDDIDDDGEYGD